MAKRILFGTDNQCFLDGVTFSPSSEAADFDADNLAKPTPTEFWRIPTITGGPNVAITFPYTVPYDLIAPLYVTSSPHRNIVRHGYRLNGAGWTQTNLDPGSGSGGVVPTTDVPVYALSSSGAGASNLSDTFTRHTGGDSWTVAAKFLFRIDGSPSAHLEYELKTDGSNRVFAQIDTSDGSINSSGAAGTWGLTSATTALVSGSWWKLEIVATTPTEGDIITTIHLLTTGFSKTTVGGETASVGGALVERAAAPGDFIDSMTGRLAYWAHAGLDAADLLDLSDRRDRERWYATRGYLHAFKEFPTRQYGNSLTVYFLDPNNINSQLDVSLIYVGPIFRPTRNFISVSIVPSSGSPESVTAPGGQRLVAAEPGERVWRIRFLYQSQADALGGFHELGMRLHRYSPLLAILDSDEATYGQEQMIYGTIDGDLDLAPSEMMSSGPTWPVDIPIRELLK